jgi:hypothetical protein
VSTRCAPGHFTHLDRSWRAIEQLLKMIYDPLSIFFVHHESIPPIRENVTNTLPRWYDEGAALPSRFKGRKPEARVCLDLKKN